MDFYLNVRTYGNDILYIGYANGKKIQKKIKYKPSLFILGNDGSNYRTINGESLILRKPGTIRETKKYIEDHKDIENFKIFGNTRFEYCLISDLFENEIEWDINKIRIAMFDIEVDSDPDTGGFAKPEDPFQPITSISLKFLGEEKTYLFGYYDFNVPDNVIYIKCKDEYTLIKKFIDVWSYDYPDIVSGWNCIPVNQSVWLKNEIKSIGDLTDNELVYSNILNKYPITNKKVVNIHLMNGHVVSSSEDHIFPIHYIEKESYTKLNINGNKNLCKYEDFKVKDIPIDEYSCFVEYDLHDNTNLDFDNISYEECYLAGFIYTDGTLKDPNKPNYGYTIYQKDRMFLDNFDSMVHSKICGNDIKGHYRYISPKLIPSYLHECIYVNGKKKLDLFKLSKLSRIQFLYFLSGLLDGDGCVGDGRKLIICNFNNDLYTLFELFLWNGIFSTIQKNSIRLHNISHDKLFLNHKKWKSCIYKNLRRDSSQKAKQIKFKIIGNKCYVPIKNIEYTDDIVEMIDVKTDTGYFITKGIKTHNCSGFDIPYIINRFNKIVSEDNTKKLSPWGIIQESKKRKFNTQFNTYEEQISYKIGGVSILDYLDLYKKYQPGGSSQESYRLDYICEVEINERKVQYDGSLHRLYTENKQLFYEYNIQDTLLIEKLDNKCKLFNLALTLTYNSKTNPDDVFHQTSMWDSMIYDYLKKRGVQVPLERGAVESVGYEGAYVKVPLLGFYKWIVTLDATSLYPSVIMGKNISPETLVPPEQYTDNMRRILAQAVNVDNLLNQKIDLSSLKEDNVTLTPNGQFFRTDVKGFLPEMVSELFAKRVMYKNTMLDLQKEYERLLGEGKSEDELKEITFNITRYNSLQDAVKKCLNSLYGCLGSQYFRLFDVRQAEAITLEGQLSNRWVMKKVNEYLNSTLGGEEVDRILGSDTDSMLICLSDLVDKIAKDGYDDKKIISFLIKATSDVIQPEVNKFTEELSDYVNSYENRLKYKVEKICSSGIFLAKKRYALNVYANEGVIYNEPKIKITGLEIVKSSTPKLVRTALKDCIKLILNEDKNDFISYISTFKKKYYGSNVEDISFPRGVNGLGKYSDNKIGYTKGTPIHVRGSIVFNSLLKKDKLSDYELIKEGDKIKFCYLKLPNPAKENVISFPERLPNELMLTEYIDYDMMWNKSFLEPLKTSTDLIGWEVEKRYTINDFLK